LVAERHWETNVQIIRLATAPEQPWPNGGGTTRELWLDVEPESGALRLRISVASLARAAAFSALPGLLRTFMPIDDIAADLLVNGLHQRVGRHQMLQFSGDADTALIALDKPGRALNLMSDRRVASHAISLRSSGTAAALALVALEPWHGALRFDVGDLVLAHGAPIELAGKAAVIELEPYRRV
jgi:uncharacterized protein